MRDSRVVISTIESKDRAYRAPGAGDLAEYDIFKGDQRQVCFFFLEWTRKVLAQPGN